MNLTEDTMIKKAVVKDDPQPDGELKKNLEELLEKEASEKNKKNES